MYDMDDGAHRLIVTALDGAERLSSQQFDDQCACNRWSWHVVAESEDPDDHPLIRQAVKAELLAVDDYGGGCEGCGFPLVKGRTRCHDCGEKPQAA